MLGYFQAREGTSINALLEEFMLGFQYLFRAERN